MAMVLVIEEDVGVICAYAPQVGRSECKKDQFYNDMAGEWDLQNPEEVVLGMRDFNGHVGRRIDGFDGVHGIGKEMLREEDYLSFATKRSCAWQIRGLRRWSRKK